MITRNKISSPWPNKYPVPVDYDLGDEMITKKQRQKLTELIYQQFTDEDSREKWLNSLDDMTSDEAIELLLELGMS
ncbi:MAG: hypothetical protein WC069_06035 [Candidatus Shapirobacteria bacterium]|jgi:hypothetical protein